jgi:hypothetical protein
MTHPQKEKIEILLMFFEKVMFSRLEDSPGARRNILHFFLFKTNNFRRKNISFFILKIWLQICIFIEKPLISG